MVPWCPASSAAPAATRIERRWLVGRDMRVFARFGLECAPVGDDIGTVAVNLEPRDSFREDGTMEQRALRPRWRLRVQQTRLDDEDLLQPFDVPPRDRKQA